MRKVPHEPDVSAGRGAATPASPVVSSAALVEILRSQQLLTALQLEELARSLPTAPPDAKALARELRQRDWLTPFQINRLFQGRAHELVLGSYLLLEPLGKGGMGEVFKARHQKLERVVALKLIRQERLSSADAVRRFRREIQLAAQVEDPNIVHAYDAEEVGGVTFLVMEYMEGTDLAKLVGQQGPLPVAQACDFIRQAALGLQHAFECGLVHRDIKPQNLLVSRQGPAEVIKILDLGLARAAQSTGQEGSSTLTQEGMVMGTLDYLSPEQAEEAHAVDIRSDLYSLGCTFYFLLTGRVPFPGGTLLNKMHRHRFKEPVPVEQLRSEVAQPVAAVVRRLMAKRPEDRFQTPTELVSALTALAIREPESRGLPVQRSVNTVIDPALLNLANASTADDEVSARVRQNAAVRRRWRLLRNTGVGVLLGLLLLLVTTLKWRGGDQPQDKDKDRRPEPPSSSSPPAVPLARAKPPKDQVKEVLAEVKKLNPRLDTSKIQTQDDGKTVSHLTIPCDEVSDLTPIMALSELTYLHCYGYDPSKGKLHNLPALGGLPLQELYLLGLAIRDLSALAGLRGLTRLEVKRCPQVSDLKPLAKLPLRELHLRVCLKIGLSDSFSGSFEPEALAVRPPFGP